MTLIEWVSGFKVVMDLSIMTTLIIYLIHRRDRWGSAPYCIATGLVILAIGNTIGNAWIWIALLEHHELDTKEKIAEVYPLIGSQAWLWGSVISVIGLIKLIREFGLAYISKCDICWIMAVVLATIIPFISIWV